MKMNQFLLCALCLLMLSSCKTYEYNGKKFENEHQMERYIREERIEIERNNQKLKAAEEEENAYKYFTDKYDSKLILDLRNKENSEILSKAYFNQYDNTKSVNRYYIKDQFEYNRDKEKYKLIKKSKYLFFEAESMALSDYDFKKSSFFIERVNISLHFPDYTIHYKIINLAGTGTVNYSSGIGGYYEIINSPQVNIKADVAESFLQKFKNGKVRRFVLLEIIKAKDEKSGIKCSNLKDTLFNGNGKEEDINYYVKPTCVSEKWDKLIVRNLETKIAGYYILDGSDIYKWMDKK